MDADIQSWCLYASNLWRTTSEEKRELERLEKPIYNSVRQAAEVHRQVAIGSYICIIASDKKSSIYMLPRIIKLSC